MASTTLNATDPSSVKGLQPVAGPLPRLMMLYLGGVGPVPPRTEAVVKTPLLIGRAAQPPAGFTLAEDGKVSAIHAEVRLTADGARVRDLGSRNGSFLNGVRLSGDAELHDRDVLRVGHSLLLFRDEPVPREKLSAQQRMILAKLLGSSPEVHRLGYALAAAATARAPRTPTSPSEEEQLLANVLLLGETGTGKELAARLLHELSGRTGPFIAKNMSALSMELSESLLFGHKRGAFTGAIADTTGIFRGGHRGTLLLDEIGDLQAAIQPKLLRVLDERQVWPVGGHRLEPYDVRIISATNHDLVRAKEQGRFRQDLYRRLAGIVIELPPLRHRREDILLLFMGFLDAGVRRLSSKLCEALLLHPWPENIGEMVQLAAKASVCPRDGGELGYEPLARFLTAPGPPAGPAEEANAPPPPTPRSPLRMPLSADEVRAAFAQTQGNVSRMAKALNRSRKAIRNHLYKLRLKVKEGRGNS